MIAALVLTGLAFAAAPADRQDRMARCKAVRAGLAAAHDEQARLPDFDTVRVAITLSAVPSFCLGYTVVTVMTVQANGWTDTPRWIARRVRLASGSRRATTQWLDAQACPALPHALAALTRLSIGFRVPGLADAAGPEQSTSIVLDGTDYTVAGDAIQPDGHTARLSLAGNAGPVADWSQHMLAALEPCWSATPPVPQRSHTR